MHVASWDSHPSVDLTEAPSFVATAHGNAASTLDFRTGRKYHCPSCLSSPGNQKCLFDHVACEFPHSRKKVKDVLNYLFFKEQTCSLKNRKQVREFIPSFVSSLLKLFYTPLHKFFDIFLPFINRQLNRNNCTASSIGNFLIGFSVKVVPNQPLSLQFRKILNGLT